MKRRVKHTVYLVLAFLALFVWGLVLNEAKADELRIGLGYGILKSEGFITQELLYRPHPHWYLSIAETENHRRDYRSVRYAAGHQVVFRDGKKIEPFLRLGFAHFRRAPNDWVSAKNTYDLAIGFRFWDVVELEIDQHQSTAGRSPVNIGLDGVYLGVLWKW